MGNALRHQRLTNLLERFSQRLEELLVEVRRYETHLPPPELIDEIASTTGELMLVLVEHWNIHKTEEGAPKVISHAQRLREGMRSRELRHDQIAEAVHALTQEVDLIIRQDKQAA